MAESQKRSSDVNSKDKDGLLDMDIGNDFLSSWKSEGGAMDFDFAPVPKGNKKQFDFGKAGMDFNLDDDFGKMPSFDLDISDLDISPPLKKDGNSKENLKESSSRNDQGKADRKLSSFDMDMSDLDISPPLKKDGKSDEKSKESSRGTKKGKADRFAFAFDFDVLENFNFEPSPAKEGSKAQKDKDYNDTSENFDFEPSLTKEGSKAQKNKDNIKTSENIDFDPSSAREVSIAHRNKHNIESLGNLDSEHNNESLENLDSDLSISKEGSKAQKNTEYIKSTENFNFEASLAKGGSKAQNGKDNVESSEIFNSEPSLAKESSEAQKNKDNVESSPEGTQCRDIEDSLQINRIENMSAVEDVPQKPSSQGTMSTFDMDCQVYGSSDFETRRKNKPLKLAVDNSVTSKCSAKEALSDKAKIPPQAIVASTELPKNRPVEKSISPDPVDLEACTGKGADLSYDLVTNNEPSGDRSSEAPGKVDSINKKITGSIGEQDVNVISIATSTSNNKLTKSEFNGERNQCGVVNHVVNNRARTERGHSVIENYSITNVVSSMCSNMPTSTENQGPALEILKLPSVSQPPDKLLAVKEAENGKEHSVQKASSTQTTDNSLSNKKKGFASLFEGRRRDSENIQKDINSDSLHLQHSKTLLREERPHTQSRESYKGLKTSGVVPEAAGVQDGKKLNDSFTQNLEVVTGKSAQRQRETSLKDLETLSACTSPPGSSMEINRRTAQIIKVPITLASLPAKNNISVEERKLSAGEGSRKNSDLLAPKLSSLSSETNKRTSQISKMPITLPALPVMKNTRIEEKKLTAVEERRKNPNLLSPKLSSLNLDSMKSPNRNDIKSDSQTSLMRMIPAKIAHFADSQKQTPSTPSLKRKTLEEYNADTIVLYPSKRIFQSPIENRNFADASIRVLNKKVSNESNAEDDCVESTLGNYQLSTLNKGQEISIFVQNNSNIKQAEAYTKELDDICTMLRKKQEEAKELLVRVTVNSNKLLLLNHPILEQKIHTIQNSFATLMLNNIRA